MKTMNVILNTEKMNAINILSDLFKQYNISLCEDKDTETVIRYNGELNHEFPVSRGHVYVPITASYEASDLERTWLAHSEYVIGYEDLMKKEVTAIWLVALAVTIDSKEWKKVLRSLLEQGSYSLRWGWEV